MIPDVLYFVWFGHWSNRPLLEPRTPCNCAMGEDIVTPRICMAESVEQCLQAIGPDRLVRYSILWGETDDGETPGHPVFLMCKFYTSKMDKKYLLCPEHLQETGKVPDAIHNREWWYTRPITPHHTKERTLMSYEYDVIQEINGMTLFNFKNVKIQ